MQVTGTALSAGPATLLGVANASSVADQGQSTYCLAHQACLTLI